MGCQRSPWKLLATYKEDEYSTGGRGDMEMNAPDVLQIGRRNFTEFPKTRQGASI
jgi:hypothetical protein